MTAGDVFSLQSLCACDSDMQQDSSSLADMDHTKISINGLVRHTTT